MPAPHRRDPPEASRVLCTSVSAAMRTALSATPTSSTRRGWSVFMVLIMLGNGGRSHSVMAAHRKRTASEKDTKYQGEWTGAVGTVWRKRKWEGVNARDGKCAIERAAQRAEELAHVQQASLPASCHPTTWPAPLLAWEQRNRALARRACASRAPRRVRAMA